MLPCSKSFKPLLKNPRVSSIIKANPFEHFLGAGAFKWVYSSGDKAIALTIETNQMEVEHLCLAQLTELGLPTVKILSSVFTHDGAIAVMSKLYSIRFWTPKLEMELSAMAEIMLSNNVFPTDLQVMYNKFKEPVLVDPYNIDDVGGRTQIEFWMTDGGYCLRLPK